VTRADESLSDDFIQLADALRHWPTPIPKDFTLTLYRRVARAIDHLHQHNHLFGEGSLDLAVLLRQVLRRESEITDCP